MKVKNCEGCEHYLVDSYKNNYANFRHCGRNREVKFSFCQKYQKRCTEVKECEMGENG